MAHYYNQHHTPAPEFPPGTKVWLLHRNIKTTRPMEKLDYRKIGPYEVIEQQGKSSYLLKLPPSLKRLHPIFHVSLLEPYIHPDVIPDRFSKHPSTHIKLSPDTSTNPEVASILDSRKIG